MTRQLRDPWALGFGETMTVLVLVEVRPDWSVATARACRLDAGRLTNFGRGARCPWLYWAVEAASVVEAAAEGTIEGASLRTGSCAGRGRPVLVGSFIGP
jgi:hypothetical protein